jgi:hypothetical protein
MIRRDLLASYGYRDRGWPEDYDLILRLLASGHELGVVPKKLVAWRNEPGRLSQNSESYSLESFTACKAAHLADSFLARGEISNAHFASTASNRQPFSNSIQAALETPSRARPSFTRTIGFERPATASWFPLLAPSRAPKFARR